MIYLIDYHYTIILYYYILFPIDIPLDNYPSVMYELYCQTCYIVSYHILP